MFAPKAASVLAAYHYPEMLRRYVEVEDRIGHTFTNNWSIHTQVCADPRFDLDADPAIVETFYRAMWGRAPRWSTPRPKAP